MRKKPYFYAHNKSNMNISENFLIILAGGIGSRLWPLSTENMPKQFIDVWGCGKTLLQATVMHFDGIIPVQNIWVTTAKEYETLVKEQLPEVPPEQVLCEPCHRNTAPSIAYAAWKIKMHHPKANIVVTPSDHLILNNQEFVRIISNSLKFTAETDSIITLGIKPLRPETNFGYICGDWSCPSPRNKELFMVDEFKEKPNKETAEAYLKQEYLWNAGIFIWNVRTIINAYRVYQPAIAGMFQDMFPVFYTDNEYSYLQQHYPELENISVDYAIMEKAEELYVYPADINWNDMGTWKTLQASMKKDLYGNVLLGENISTFDTNNSIIRMVGKKKVVIQGLDGYIVADYDGQVLVCKLSEEQLLTELSKKDHNQ